MSNEVANITVDELVFGEKAAENLQRALGWCKAVQNSGMLPTHIKTPQQALVTMLKGKELGLSPIVALSQVYVVGGKAEISGTIMEALLRKGGVSITPEEWTNEKCVLLFERPGYKPFRSEFTFEDAKKAGLLKNAVWSTYTKDMLYWRALSRGGRRIGADLIHGCYVEGEIRHEPHVIRDAEIVDQPQRPAAQKASKMASLAATLAAPEPKDGDGPQDDTITDTLPGMASDDDGHDDPKWSETSVYDH